MKIPGVILAAGEGRRFGDGNKLLARLRGRPIIEHAINRVLGSSLRPVFVVLGHCSEDIERLLKERFKSSIKAKSLRVVINPAWRRGKSSSRAAALRALPRAVPGAVFFLGDMPFVEARWLERFISVFKQTEKICLARHGEDLGPPSAFPRSYFKELGRAKGDRSAVEVLDLAEDSYLSVPFNDSSAPVDIDTRRTLRLMENRLIRRGVMA